MIEMALLTIDPYFQRQTFKCIFQASLAKFDHRHFGQVFDTGVFDAMLPLIRDQQMAVRKEVERERVEGRIGSICVHQSALWCNITGSKNWMISYDFKM